MAEMIQIECDFRSLVQALRKVAPEAAKELRGELRDIAKELAVSARSGLPSGMASAKTGIKWGYWQSKGAYAQAGGASSPKSWAGAWEGGQSGTKGFRHPVYPSASQPQKKWHWAGAHGAPKQMPGAPLHKAWYKERASLVARSDVAISRAVRAAGLQGA